MIELELEFVTLQYCFDNDLVPLYEWLKNTEEHRLMFSKDIARIMLNSNRIAKVVQDSDGLINLFVDNYAAKCGLKGDEEC